MEDTPNSPAPLSFYDLLDHLSRNGFRIGVDSHLRLQRLLRHVSGQCSPEKLRTLLCPIFATNKKEQEFFYSAYDAYFELNQSPDSSFSLRTKRKVEVEREPIWIRRWPYILVALSLTIIFAGVSYRYKQQTQVASPQAIQAVVKIPTEIRITDQPVPELIYAIRWIAVLAPLLLFFLYETYRRNRRSLQLRVLRRNEQPHVFSLHPSNITDHIFKSPDFNNAVRPLLGRQQSDFSVLDLPATVIATTKLLGYPQFRYKPGSKVPEYTILIERSILGDHLQSFFDQLANALERQGVVLTRYYFESDPRVCFRVKTEENPNIPNYADLEERSVPLRAVLDKHEDDRLLILGTCEGFFDPIVGTVKEWTRSFEKWNQRALITPIPVDEWSHREEILSRHFFVAPATVKGIHAVGLYFERADTEHNPLRLSQEPALSADLDSTDVIRSLKMYLGRETFQWLCACAVYPRLEWNLTVFLRSLPCLKGISDEIHLLRLLRLPWFASGAIPQPLRQQLLQELSPELYLKIREAIVGILGEAVSGTHSYGSRPLNVAVPRANHVLPQDIVKKIIRIRLRGRIVRDYIFVRFLESKPNRLLDLVLPNSLSKLFFPNGNSALGLRVVARFVLSVMAGVALWITAPVIVRAIKTEPTLSAANLSPSVDSQLYPEVTPTLSPRNQVSPLIPFQGSPVPSTTPTVPDSTPQPTSTILSTTTPEVTPEPVSRPTVANVPSFTPTASPTSTPTTIMSPLVQCPEVKVVCSVYSLQETRMDATTYSATASTSGGKQLLEREYFWTLLYDHLPATKEQGRIKSGQGKSTVEIEWVIQPHTTPVLTAKVVVTGYNAGCFTENSCTVPVRESPRETANECECGTCGSLTCCPNPGYCIACGPCGYVCCSTNP